MSTTRTPASIRDEVLDRLSEIATNRATGVLTALRGKHRRLFCFVKGDLTYAVSNVIEEQFLATLVRGGTLTEEAARQTNAQAAEKGCKPAEVLREAGHADGDLNAAMQRHADEMLRNTVEWPRAELAFAKGLPNLGAEPQAALPTCWILLDLVRESAGSAASLRTKLGSADAVFEVREALAERFTGRLEDDDVLRHVLTSADGKRDVATLVGESPGDEVGTLSTILGLQRSGALTALDRKADGGIGREELSGLLDRAQGADHYGVLGILQNVSPDAVRHSYYRLARRVHPDRFRTGPLQDLLPRVEEFFAKVTEAYNTLSDAELRAEYDRSLTEATETSHDPEQDSGHLARRNYLHGKNLVAKRRMQEAVRFLENALQLDPDKAEYHLELGRVLITNARRRTEAEERLQRAIELDPTLVDAYVALGQLYRKTHRDGDAARMFRQVLNWEPGHLEATRELEELGQTATEDRGGLLRGLFRS